MRHSHYSQPLRHLYFSVLAIGGLLALTALNVLHFVHGEAWPGYTPAMNYSALFFAAIFLWGCYSLARYQTRRPVIPFIAFGSAIMQGVLVLVGEGQEGYILFGSGTVLLILGFATLNYRVVRETRHVEAGEVGQRPAA